MQAMQSHSWDCLQHSWSASTAAVSSDSIRIGCTSSLTPVADVVRIGEVVAFGVLCHVHHQALHTSARLSSADDRGMSCR